MIVQSYYCNGDGYLFLEGNEGDKKAILVLLNLQDATFWTGNYFVKVLILKPFITILLGKLGIYVNKFIQMKLFHFELNIFGMYFIDCSS